MSFLFILINSLIGRCKWNGAAIVLVQGAKVPADEIILFMWLSFTGEKKVK